MSTAAKKEIKKRIERIEEAYEYMLAYAAQGLSGDEESASVTQIREELEGMEQAMEGLVDTIGAAAKAGGLQPPAGVQAFIGVVERDTANSQAAVKLVLGQSNISSQLVDNLNALIHLRALLTDLFLLDELLAG